MRRRFLIAAVLAAVATPVTAQDPPAPITRQDALRFPPGRLFETLFEQSIGLIAEVERPTFSGLLGPNAPMNVLRFATVPQRSGGGLCRATVIGFALAPDEPQMRAFMEAPGNATLRERVTNIMAEEVYKAVPEGADCRQGGRVLPQGSGDLAQRHYFTVRGGAAWIAVLAFRTATEAFRLNPGAAVRCRAFGPRDTRERCGQPAAVVQALDLGALIAVAFHPCEQDRTLNCVVGTFLVGAGNNTQQTYRIAVPIEVVTASVTSVRLQGPVDIQYVDMAFD